MITLPVTCKQLHLIVLIGFPLSIIIGVFFINPILVIIGVILTCIVWIISILDWIDNGHIKCKCGN